MEGGWGKREIWSLSTDSRFLFFFPCAKCGKKSHTIRTPNSVSFGYHFTCRLAMAIALRVSVFPNLIHFSAWNFVCFFMPRIFFPTSHLKGFHLLCL